MNIGGPIVNLSKQIFKNAGFEITNDKSTIRFNFNYGSPRNQAYYESLQPGQIHNQIPGSFEITRKDLLMRNVQESKYLKYIQNKNNEYVQHLTKNNIPVPISYQIPQQLELFYEKQLNIKQQNYPNYVQQENNPWYIYKPTMSSRGQNIQIFQKIDEITGFNESKNATIQIYEQQPLIYHNKKVDIRLLILITSIDPFIVYLYPEGLGRLAQNIYQAPNTKNIKYSSIHLTNTALVKHNKAINKIKLSTLLDYASQEFLNRCINQQHESRQEWQQTFGLGAPMHKVCSLIHLKQKKNMQEHKQLFIQQLQQQLIQAITDTLLHSYDKFLISSRIVTSHIYRYPKSFFGYYGVDILINKYGYAKVLEINASPNLKSDENAEFKADNFKKDFLYEALNLIGIPAFFNTNEQDIIIPSRNINNQSEISESIKKYIIDHEGIKNRNYDNFSDKYAQRVLNQLKDEQSRQVNLIRIFPDGFSSLSEPPTKLNGLCLNYIQQENKSA